MSEGLASFSCDSCAHTKSGDFPVHQSHRPSSRFLQNLKARLLWPLLAKPREGLFVYIQRGAPIVLPVEGAESFK